MGDDASERAATDDEIAQMQALVRAGARTRARSASRRRSSTCTSRTTAAACRRNHAAPDELVALAVGARASSAAARSSSSRARSSTATTTTTATLILAMAPRLGAAGAPQHAHAAAARARRLVAQPRVRAARRAAEGSGDPPDVRDQPAGRALLARHDVPVRRDADLPRHAAPCRSRSASQRLRDPAVRDQMREELADPTRPRVRVRLAGAARRDRSRAPSTSGTSDRTRDARSPGRRARIRSTRSSTSRSPTTSHTQFVLAGAARPRSDAPPPRRCIRAPLVMAGQQRRRRAPAVVLRRRLHHPAAHRMGAATSLTLEAAVARLTAMPARVARPRGSGRRSCRARPPTSLLHRPRAASAHPSDPRVRARLPCRQRPLRRRRDRLPSRHRQRRGAAGGRQAHRRLPGHVIRGARAPVPARQPFFVSQKILSILAMRSSVFWASATLERLLRRTRGLGGVPEEGVEVGVLLEVLGLEVVGPQHPEVVLDHVGPLFLDDDGPLPERLVLRIRGTSRWPPSPIRPRCGPGRGRRHRRVGRSGRAQSRGRVPGRRLRGGGREQTCFYSLFRRLMGEACDRPYVIAVCDLRPRGAD